MKKRILFVALAILPFLVGSGFKNDFFEVAKQVEIFTTLFKELNMNYVDETNPAELMDTAIKSMLEDLDPYTRFMNEQDIEEYRIRNTGEYSGIGAIVRSYKDKLLVVEPYKESPADKAGLKAGDEIIQIGDIKVSDFKEDASELLKGAVNSEVSLVFTRQGKTMNTVLKREEIDVPAVPFYKMVNDKTGYIVLSKFNNKASSQTKAALEDLKQQGATSIILDLRDNPGGLLNEAIEVCNLFVPKGELIVSTKSKVKKFNQSYYTKNNPVDAEIPLVVLLNGKSASASEIVGGALQDLDRAVVIGAQSYGKGLVQRPVRLTYGTQLKVTISRYYTPSGRCIQAIDYWNRDENGKAIKNQSFNEFKTRNGRKVFDGGGIMPDLVVDGIKNSSLTKALIENNLIFDYATEYYYKNNITSLNNYAFTAADYQDFKKFVATKNFNYETKTEQALKKVLMDEEIKDFGPKIREDYQLLLNDIEEAKLQVLDLNKDGIMKDLESEIVKRYFYREGLYNFYLSHDDAILQSSKLLADTNKYAKLLKG